MSVRKRRKDWIPGLIITLVLLAAALFFVGMLMQTKMIPNAYLIIGTLVVVVLVLVVGILTHRVRNLVRFIIGCVLAVLLGTVLVLGSVYLVQTRFALGGISGVNTQVTQMTVYVRAEDTAASIEDTAGYNYGILQTLDRVNTNGAMERLNSQLGTALPTTEYAGLTELMDGLLNGTSGAVVMNQGYLQVIEEMEGYTDIASRIRPVGTIDVKSTIESTESPSGDSAVSLKGDVYTVYISGIDTRGEMTSSSRSDVNIIATINMKTHQALLVSTPRDYFVPLSISDGQPDKLTHAGIYGIDVCMDTLGMLYGIEINNYFRINFSGFVQVIDALGGINVYSDYDFDSQNILGYHYNQGMNYLNGEQALVFARERFAFAEGDRQRGKNQMAVIRGVVEKATSPELLKNYSSILSSLSGTFGTNISYEDIARILQQQLKNGGSWNIVSYSVNGTGDTQKPYSMSQNAYVMIPDYSTVETAKTLMQKVRDGETISQSEADASASAAE